MVNKKFLCLYLPFFMICWWLPDCVKVSKLCPPRSSLSLRANPYFSPNQLSANIRVWHARLKSAINNPYQSLRATRLASSNNTYYYGRTLNTHITSLLQALRVTKDPLIFIEVDRLAELMRAQLRDRSILSAQGSTYETDGYLNWLNNHDVDYQGTDIHKMDEMLTHS